MGFVAELKGLAAMVMTVHRLARLLYGTGPTGLFEEETWRRSLAGKYRPSRCRCIVPFVKRHVKAEVAL